MKLNIKNDNHKYYKQFPSISVNKESLDEKLYKNNNSKDNENISKNNFSKEKLNENLLY